MENDIREKIERFKIKAEGFLKENIKAFIIDVHDTYYFCDIIFVSENYLEVQNFKGIREGEKEMLFWADVVKLEDYKERENE
jgi:hypothetical protein